MGNLFAIGGTAGSAAPSRGGSGKNSNASIKASAPRESGMEMTAAVDKFNVFKFCQAEEEPLGAALMAAMRDPGAELGLPLASVKGFCTSLDGKLAATGGNKAARILAVDSLQIMHLLILESGSLGPELFPDAVSKIAALVAVSMKYLTPPGALVSAIEELLKVPGNDFTGPLKKEARDALLSRAEWFAKAEGKWSYVQLLAEKPREAPLPLEYQACLAMKAAELSFAFRAFKIHSRLVSCEGLLSEGQDDYTEEAKGHLLLGIAKPLLSLFFGQQSQSMEGAKAELQMVSALQKNARMWLMMTPNDDGPMYADQRMRMSTDKNAKKAREIFRSGTFPLATIPDVLPTPRDGAATSSLAGLAYATRLMNTKEEAKKLAEIAFGIVKRRSTVL